MTLTDDQPRVRISGAMKKFGNNVVLNNIDLEVRAGEVAVLIGPSGAGKSTLIRCINGLERLSNGFVEIDGVRLEYREHTQPHARARGHALPVFHLFPHLTALENVTMAPIMVSKMSKAEARGAKAAALLDRVGLGDKKQSLSERPLRRATAASRHRTSTRDDSQAHAVR